MRLLCSWAEDVVLPKLQGVRASVDIEVCNTEDGSYDTDFSYRLLSVEGETAISRSTRVFSHAAVGQGEDGDALTSK